MNLPIPDANLTCSLEAVYRVAQTRKGKGWPSRITSALPQRQQRVARRCQELKQEVGSLRQLRQIAGKAQIDVAAALNIKQPSVSKIEQQADMYLSTLRGYVEAIGGELELVVKLPERPVLGLYRLSRALGRTSRSPQRVARRRA